MSRKLDEIKKCLVDAGDYRVSIHDTDMKWLIARMEKLEEALKFYANCSYQSQDLLSFPSIHKPSDYIIDGGRRAREALADDSGESTKKEESE